MITIISAMSSNRVIGIDNKLPWRLPEDLKRFKSLTTGKVIVMGRKTFESIGSKPLPNRVNIVLTRDKSFKSDGILVYNSLEELLPIFPDLVIIGGSEIYSQTIKYANVIELTYVDKYFDGDSYFPEINPIFVESYRDSYKNDEFEYHFITYTRNEKS